MSLKTTKERHVCVRACVCMCVYVSVRVRVRMSVPLYLKMT